MRPDAENPDKQKHSVKRPRVASSPAETPHRDSQRQQVPHHPASGASSGTAFGASENSNSQNGTSNLRNANGNSRNAASNSTNTSTSQNPVSNQRTTPANPHEYWNSRFRFKCGFLISRRSREQSYTRKPNGHSIPEFALALFIVLFLVTFPLIDLVGIGMAAASEVLLVNQATSRAAAQQRFPEALEAVKDEAISGLQTGMARFSKMVPIDGYQGCGIDLYIQATDIHTQSISLIGPNAPLPAPPDPLVNVYEYTGTAKFQVSPMVPLTSIPFIGQVPGLGQPVILTFNSSKALEHVAGLATKVVAVGYTPASALGPYPGRNGSSPADNDVPHDAVGWNYPNIYDQIAAKGQVIVAEDVFTVPANQEAWTISSALAAPGQHVWIDTHAEGEWTDTGWSPYNANGNPDPAHGYTDGYPTGALVSQVGDAGPIFMAGETLLDYAPTTSGPVEFRCNDGPGWFHDNTGQMVVRVIVTKAG